MDAWKGYTMVLLLAVELVALTGSQLAVRLVDEQVDWKADQWAEAMVGKLVIQSAASKVLQMAAARVDLWDAFNLLLLNFLSFFLFLLALHPLFK